MRLQVVGCNHHQTPLELRERLAFTPGQATQALAQMRARFPQSEAVLLSTCNRMELYTACDTAEDGPTHDEIVDFLADFHGLSPMEIFDDLFERSGEDAVRHLFTVAASLDSMVVGEAQILSQIKQAYQLAAAAKNTGPLMHAVFQAAMRVAKRVATETSLQRKRVSIPSIAVGDFAQGIFERLDDKAVLVVGAGEMAEETLRYLQDAGARNITVVNRDPERAERLAARFHGSAAPWGERFAQLTRADLVVSTTGAEGFVVRLEDYKAIEPARYQRPLFVLDLAVPRDFDPAIGDRVSVYLYSLDDLKLACEANRKARELEWPAAKRIIDEETGHFMTELHHRATGPTIKRLKENATSLMEEEVRRLLNRLEPIDERAQSEVRQSFRRLVNKLLHPPLESLRHDAQTGGHHGLLDAIKHLFQIRD